MTLLSRLRILALSAAALTIVLFAGSSPVSSHGQGTEQRRAEEPDRWTTINKDYNSQRYVDLDQINASNVRDLKETCEVQLNEPVYFTSGLLKVGRTLYVTTLRGTYAVDAETCELRWRQAVDFQQGIAAIGQRGAGYLDGRIFRGTADGRLIAMDANTGEVLWDVQAANPAAAEAFSSAPIAAEGKVFIGIGVSDDGIAGRLMAFDAQSGSKIWSFNTTLGKPAGGGFWTTYSLDLKTGELFGSVSNPFPDFSRALQANDEELTATTNSFISINAMNNPQASLNWSYQATPYDQHDWDLAAAPTLYRTRSGKDMVAAPGKSGLIYGVDRSTHQLAFSTPGTTVVPNPVLDNSWQYVCPGLQGGALYNGTAYDPATGLLFAGMTDACTYYSANPAYGGQIAIKDAAAAAKDLGPSGWITAVDGETGKVVWQKHADSQVQAGLVTTKSGLLLAGEANGMLLAMDARTGTVLKRLDVQGALNNGLISYEADGQQYVAAAVGGSGENPHAVAGPLRVSVFGLHAGPAPRVIQLDRMDAKFGPGVTAANATYVQTCGQCHGVTGIGASAPPLIRQSQLADPKVLRAFLDDVPAPMPRLHPGVVNDKDVALIASFLRTNVFLCGQPGGQSCELPGKPSTGGTPAWQAVYSVLTSPRCINCHTGPSPSTAFIPGYPLAAFDYPRQGDDRHPHYFNIIRGPETDSTGQLTGKGAPFARCASCHGVANDPKTGIPGANDGNGVVDWALAPPSMSWETTPGMPMNGAELCAQLTDKTRNGNRGPAELLQHVATAPAVLWGWDPGVRPNGEERTKPPLGHEAFVHVFEQWIQEGSPCPAAPAAAAATAASAASATTAANGRTSTLAAKHTTIAMVEGR